jgi:transposase-like protein
VGISRRTFAREVRLASARRLEGGASIAEISRAFEVNPNVLHRWRKEFREGLRDPRLTMSRQLETTISEAATKNLSVAATLEWLADMELEAPGSPLGVPRH